MNNFLVVRQGDTERWTLNDPAARNALSEGMVDGLLAACERALRDSSLRAVVLTGAAGAFCAGGSLSGFSSAIGRSLPPGEADPLLAMNRRFGDLLHALANLTQWLICAVDGPAMGGGFGLVCCADRVLATQRSVFATPEVTLGLPPAQIAPFVWQRLGERQARDCLLSGRRYRAREAHEMGLVHEVVADDALEDVLADTLQACSRAAPGALAETKRLLRLLSGPVPDLRDEAAASFSQALRGREAATGLQAFAQRQIAPWVAPVSGARLAGQQAQVSAEPGAKGGA